MTRDLLPSPASVRLSGQQVRTLTVKFGRRYNKGASE